MSCYTVFCNFHQMRYYISICSQRETLRLETWLSYFQVTDRFLIHILENVPIESERFQMIEKFVCILYSKTTNMTLMNEMREAVFPKWNSPSYLQRKIPCPNKFFDWKCMENLIVLLLCMHGNELATGLSLCGLCNLLY